MHKICLIQSPSPEVLQDRLDPPLGLLYIGSYLKSKGFDVQIKDLSGMIAAEWEIPYADWYGFTTYSSNYYQTLQILKECKRRNPKSKTIAGGFHADALPQSVKKDGFDWVVRGEGEYIFERIINGEILERIVTAPVIENLDNLPFVDFDLIDISSYTRKVAGSFGLPIQSSRGCPFHCNFCASRVNKGNIRVRSVGNVVSEIYRRIEQLGIRTFHFLDDLFGFYHEWLKDFASYHLPIQYRAFIRGDTLARDGTADLLYESGCRHVSIGVESGSDFILEQMQKQETSENMALGIKAAKQAGLRVRIYLIVGFPGETWRTINETLEFVKQTKPDEFMVYPLVPYPGTPLWESPERFGMRILDSNMEHYFLVYGDKKAFLPVYETNQLNPQKIYQMREYLIAQIEESRTIWAMDSEAYT